VAKKKTTRRPNLSQETLERARAERRTDSIDTPSVSATASSAASGSKIKRAGTPISAATRVPSTEELSREYSHVMKDLRNLMILATLLLIGIIVLAIVLPHPNV
jgi:hypothetical protein